MIHPLAVLILIVFAVIYFSPAAIDGKVLSQSDVQQAGGTQVELKQFTKSEGRDILWTDGMFGGMPAFQIWGASGENYNVLGQGVYKFFTLNKSVVNPFGLLIACLIGCYILLITLKVDWRIATLGAIAYGLSTSHIILIEAGHVNKMLTLAFLAPTLAGVISIFRGNYIWGAALTALFTCCQLMANHLQITYYFFLFIGFYVLAQLIQSARNGELSAAFKAIGALAIGVLIGILPNVTRIWTTYEYSSESIRGKSELTKDGKAASDGLTKEYAFGWSLGKMESFSLLAPNINGATSAENFTSDKDSKTLDALRGLAPKDKKEEEKIQDLAQSASHYWGPQPFTSGSPYYGAVVILLFLIGCFVVRGAMKWWAIASIIFMLFVSWGSNFEGFNYLLFDYFPMFNKFRAVNMIVALGHIIAISLGFVALNQIFNGNLHEEHKNKAVFMGIASAVGLTVLTYILSMSFSYEAKNDALTFAGYSNVLTALKADREALAQSDILRSLMFILLASGLIYGALKFKLNKWIPLALVSILAIIDLIGVDKRYIADKDFVAPSKNSAYATPSKADKMVMQDKTNYRVLDLTSSPMQSARASFFHRSLGGYHAAKMIRYNELFDQQIQSEIQYLGSSLNKGIAPEVLPLLFMRTPALNMLNTKYIILDPNGEPLKNPMSNGAAWFVQNYIVTADANAELDSLAKINSYTTCVMDKENAAKLGDINIKLDSSNSIQLTKYIPDNLTYKYSAKTEQLAVFSEIYYPESKGWKTYIDGKQLENNLLKVNYTLRASRVPAGEHTLEMRFEPRSYFTGQTISRIGSLLLMLLFFGGLYLNYKKMTSEIVA